MPISLPCPQVIRGCQCELDPVTNYSSETPDSPVFFGPVNNPPDGPLNFFSPGCLSICESHVSQQAADECAARQAIECSLRGAVPIPVSVFHSTLQTCTVQCPDGLPFSWSVDSGTVVSAWQADADARAYGLACKRAMENRLCFTTGSPLPPACFGEFYSKGIEVMGGTPPYSFALTGGSLPAGLVFDSVGLIQGIPTGSGTSTFTITVTDDIGSTQVKTYVLHVVKITSPTILPKATPSTPYNYSLTVVGTSGTVVWSLRAGALPDGLELSTSGIISGTPKAGGNSAFTLLLLDGAGASCSKAFTLQVGTLVSYWKLDALAPFGACNSMADSLGLYDLDDCNSNDPMTLTPGKIGNGIGPIIFFGDNFGRNVPCPDLDITGKSFTFRFWFKIGAPLPGGSVTIAKHNIFWQIYADDITQALVFDTLNDADLFSTVALTVGVWHRVIIWRNLDTFEIGIQIDNNAPNIAPCVNDGFTINSYLFFGDNPGDDCPQSYDEMGYWVGRAWTAAERLSDWNGGSGHTYPNVPP